MKKGQDSPGTRVGIFLPLRSKFLEETSMPSKPSSESQEFIVKLLQVTQLGKWSSSTFRKSLWRGKLGNKSAATELHASAI